MIRSGTPDPEAAAKAHRNADVARTAKINRKARERREREQEQAERAALRSHASPVPSRLKIRVTDYKTRNKNLKELGYPHYGDYLKSPTWAKIRLRVLRDNQNTCFLCGGRAWVVHHCDYSKAALKGDRLEHMVALCGPCHASIEGYSKDFRKRIIAANAAVGRSRSSRTTNRTRTFENIAKVR